MNKSNRLTQLKILGLIALVLVAISGCDQPHVSVVRAQGITVVEPLNNVTIVNPIEVSLTEEEVRQLSPVFTKTISPSALVSEELPSYYSQAVQYWWCLGKIHEWANEEIPARVWATIQQIESCGFPCPTPKDDSTAGAQGLYQVMPLNFGVLRDRGVLKLGENTRDPDVSARMGSHIYAEDLMIAKAKGFSGLDLYAEAAKAYNNGPKMIGVVPEENSEPWRYEMYFRGFMTGDMTVINKWYSLAAPLCNDGSAWVATQPPCQTKPLELWQIAEQTLDAFYGFPYKDFGYLTNDGQACTWKGGAPEVDDVPGFNCGGFVLEATRSIFKHPISLEQIAVRRSGRNDPDWFWYGYDEVTNLTDLVTGQIFKVNGLDWQERAGFRVADWTKLASAMQKGFLYLTTISKPDATVGRIHHHVAVILPSDTGVWVYEATNYQGSGILKISLEAFQKKYLELSPEYRMLVTETKLP